MLLLLRLLLRLLLSPAPSFVKITQVEVLGLCPVPMAHTSSLMSEAWVDTFRFVFYMNSLELQPSPPPAEMSGRESQEEQGAGSLRGGQGSE